MNIQCEVKVVDTVSGSRIAKHAWSRQTEITGGKSDDGLYLRLTDIYRKLKIHDRLFNMRITHITAIALSSAFLSDALDFADLLRSSSSSSTTLYATPGSMPESDVPATAQVLDGSTVDRLE